MNHTMIGKKFKYKGLDFTDSYQKQLQRTEGYSYPLQDYEPDIFTRSEKSENINYHGGTVSNVLYGIRYFNFVGYAHGDNKAKRGEVRDILTKALNIETNPRSSGYYDLERETDNGEARICKARVEIPVRGRNDLASPRISYNFQLVCPSEKIYAPTRHEYEFGIGIVGGVSFPTPLPAYLSGYGGYMVIDNTGNRQAPFRLQIVGECHNPQIINLTNGQKYRLGMTTNNLVYDNTNLDFSSNDLVVEDLGVNVKSNRLSGGQIFLEPGINHIIVLSDDSDDDPAVYLRYRNTYTS